MARSVNEIYVELLDYRDEVGLPSNNNPMSMINRLLYVWALAVNQYEKLLDIFKTEITELSESASYGSENWLRSKALEYQYSETEPQVVVFNPTTFKTLYPTVNPDLRIVTAVALQLTGARFVLIKVAKGNIGSLQPLTLNEQLGLESYFQAICPAGMNTRILSTEGDDLRLTLTVYYNAQASIANIEPLIISNIRNYVNNINFNGKVVVNKIIDEMQRIQNVQNATVDIANIDNISNRGNGENFTVEASTYSGYIRNIIFNITWVAR